MLSKEEASTVARDEWRSSACFSSLMFAGAGSSNLLSTLLVSGVKYTVSGVSGVVALLALLSAVLSVSVEEVVLRIKLAVLL